MPRRRLPPALRGDRLLAAGPHHRDFHSRNLMSHQDALYWIDFQDARMGPAHYDLASLLRDSYVELDEEFVADLAEEFRQRAVPGESRDTFLRRFELMSIQRNLKALGTFGYMGAVRGSRVYLPYIPRTLEQRPAQPGPLPGVLGPAPGPGPPPRGAAVTETARIVDFRRHVGEEVHVQGWLHNKRSQRQAAVPDRAGRQRLRAGGGGQGGGAPGGLGGRGSHGAGVLAGADRQGQGGQARAGRLRGGRDRPHGLQVDPRLPDHAQGARHRVPHGEPPPLDPLPAPARGHPRSATRWSRRVRDYLDDQGFTLVDTPIFTPAACEGTTTLFGVPYFDEGTAYLTQSGQLYNEATAAAHGKVYCFGPTFRAEKSQDPPPPHRVLDGGAGDGVRPPRGRGEGRAGHDRASSWRACWRPGRRS